MFRGDNYPMQRRKLGFRLLLVSSSQGSRVLSGARGIGAGEEVPDDRGGTFPTEGAGDGDRGTSEAVDIQWRSFADIPGDVSRTPLTHVRQLTGSIVHDSRLNRRKGLHKKEEKG